MEEVQRHSVHTLVFRSLKRSHDMFVSNQSLLPEIDEDLYVFREKIIIFIQLIIIILKSKCHYFSTENRKKES